jgi:cytidylate kinase
MVAPNPPVVTVSATYGAAGSIIAPRLAERLSLRFVDRMISARANAAAVAAQSREHVSEEEEKATPSRSFFSYFARAASAGAMLTPPEMVVDEEESLRQQAEVEIEALAATGGVLLGRAGAIVLAERPNTFHVRLDGPVERRIAYGAKIDNNGTAVAARRQAETDKTRTFYVRRLYRADPAEPHWYHLILDTTVLSQSAAVEVIAMAFEAFEAGAGSKATPDC